MIDVGGVGEFEEGRPKVVSADGRPVGIIRWKDEFFAVHNNCPHQGGPVCQGHFGPAVEALPGGESIRVDLDRPVIACAWHGWEFDVRTSRSLWDDNYGVRTYEVVVEGGRVFVKASRRQSAEDSKPEIKPSVEVVHPPRIVL